MEEERYNTTSSTCTCVGLRRVTDAFNGWLKNLKNVYYCELHNTYHYCEWGSDCIIKNNTCLKSGVCSGLFPTSIVNKGQGGGGCDLLDFGSLEAFDAYKFEALNKVSFLVSILQIINNALQNPAYKEEKLTMDVFVNQPVIDSIITRFYCLFKQTITNLKRGTVSGKIDKADRCLQEMALRLLECKMVKHELKQKLLGEISKICVKHNTKSTFTTQVNRLIIHDLMATPNNLRPPLVKFNVFDLLDIKPEH